MARRLLKLPSMQLTRERDDSRANDAMARYLGGEAAAFDELCRLLMPRLRRFFVRRAGSDATSDDLVQQTLLQMYCARDRFTPGAEVSPWMFTIARRLLIDRSRRRTHAVELLTEERNAPEPASGEAGPDEIVESDEIGLRMLRSLSRLPATQRNAFELLRNEGVSVAEAARRLGITATAVKLRAHRAYQALRAELEAA
jgi:RNA polymerase sigma-70 factor (ECF subfamily)